MKEPLRLFQDNYGLVKELKITIKEEEMTNPKKTCYEGKTTSSSVALKAVSAVSIISLVTLSIAVWVIKGI